MNPLQYRLLNDFQRGFPLCPKPYAHMASALQQAPDAVLFELAGLLDHGSISRVGAVFRPGSVGAGTLAAMAVPAKRLDCVAECVGRHRGVNHSYERDHRFNLWFVATAPDRARLDRVLGDVTKETGIEVMVLPLINEYHIDLGFDLAGDESGPRDVSPGMAPPLELRGEDLRLVAALQDGLPLTDRPYLAIGERCGMDEAQVIAQVAAWQQTGVIRRFGVIVRHLELGFRANAMVVWDVPDRDIAAVGARLATIPAIRLCYRRARHLPQWRYNLYCMIHGKEREAVLGRIETISGAMNLSAYPGEVLMSVRRFKQTGPRYVDLPERSHGCA